MTLRDDKERVKTRREELGKFFYGLANATFIGLVIGCLIALLTKPLDMLVFCFVLSLGIFGTISFAIIADQIFKNK